MREDGANTWFFEESRLEKESFVGDSYLTLETFPSWEGEYWVEISQSDVDLVGEETHGLWIGTRADSTSYSCSSILIVPHVGSAVMRTGSLRESVDK